MPPLLEAPRDIIHMVARFVPFEIANAARANSEMWTRYAGDVNLWTEPCKRLLRTWQGRDVLRRHSAALLARLPQLSRQLPLLLSNHGFHVDVSRDGGLVGYFDVHAHRARIMDADTYVDVASVEMDPGFGRLVFSANGSLVACTGANRIIVFDTSTWTPLPCGLRRPHTTWCSLIFLPDDTLVAGALDGNIIMWESRSGAPRAVVAGAIAVWALAASNRALACGKDDGLVQVHTHDGKRLLSLVGHTGHVSDVAFNQDGSWLVSASNDSTARVWDVATGSMVHVHRFASEVISIALSSNGLLAVALYHVDEIRVLWLAADVPAAKLMAVDRPVRVRFAPEHAARGQLLYFSQHVGTAYPMSVIKM